MKIDRVFLLIVLAAGVCFGSGCASMQEAGKKVWGSSIAHLEDVRSDGKSEEFPMSLEKCFSLTEEILDSVDANVYLKSPDKAYLAAMNFERAVDTTQAGVFFTRLDAQHTKIEVSSMSPRLAEEVAEIIFSGLRKGEVL